MTEVKIQNIRNPDSPEYKDKIMAQLYGEFIGFLKEQGLTKGVEFESKTTEIFQCSKRIIWIDELNPDTKINILLNSISMNIEFATIKKEGNEVQHRNKLENLRFKISSDTDLELINGHQGKFDDFFDDFKNEFLKIKENIIK